MDSGSCAECSAFLYQRRRHWQEWWLWLPYLEGGGLAHFSLSQARLALNCPLSWRYRYQEGISSESSEAAYNGSMLDMLLDNYYRGTYITTSDTVSEEVWADYCAVREAVPDLAGRPQVEILVDIEGIPIPVLGYADLVTSSTVWEHKRGGGWDDVWWNAAKRQVALYASVLQKEWGGIIQVKDGKVHVEQFEIDSKLVESVHDELRAGWAARLNAATPGRACAFCDFEAVCPVSVFARLR